MQRAMQWRGQGTRRTGAQTYTNRQAYTTDEREKAKRLDYQLAEPAKLAFFARSNRLSGILISPPGSVVGQRRATAGKRRIR